MVHAKFVFESLCYYYQRKLEAQAKIDPRDMFRDQTDIYSNFDDQGLPTHDALGEPLSEKKRKKLLKQWEAQEKKYAAYQQKK